MIFIKGNIPSSKNSKVATSRGVFHSKTVQKFLREIGVQHYSASKKTVKEYKKRPNLFREYVGDYFKDVEYPIVLGFHFVRKDRRIADVHNLVQLPLDLLVAHDFIPDDNYKYIIPQCFKINDQWVTIDKNNPGVYLKIMEN